MIELDIQLEEHGLPCIISSKNKGRFSNDRLRATFVYNESNKKKHREIRNQRRINYA